jgi:hypothetical protein
MTTFTEIFDRNALTYILDNEEFYTEILGHKEMVINGEKYSPFEICRKYLEMAIGKELNHVVVTYRRVNGTGRRFAVGGLSLQSMPRLIRGTIAQEHYYDIDMVNAHPTIIKEICKRNNQATVYLNAYIDSRELIIQELRDLNPSLDSSTIKDTILSVIYYTETKNVDTIVNKSEWFSGFIKEMKQISEKVPLWFKDEFAASTAVKGENYFNLKGSALSSAVCKIED